MKKLHPINTTSGFTLIEVLVSVTLSAIILTSAYAAFQGIMKSQIRLSGVIQNQQNIYYLNEKIGKLIQQGGSIDYEEYFNRRILGYDKSMTSTGWTYSVASKYGNGDMSGGSGLYYCGKDSSLPGKDEICLEPNSTSLAPNIDQFNQSIIGKHVFYGQYVHLGFNYKSGAGYAEPIRLPPIFPIQNETLQKKGIDELYLIKKLSHGGYERTFFRHIYVQDETIPINTISCNPENNLDGCRGKVQMTRMISCDTLNNNNTNIPDGNIDAWIADPDFGGDSAGCNNINNTGKISQAANNLIWVDISGPNIDIVRAYFLPRPLKFPSRMSGVREEAFSALIQLHLEIKLAKNTINRGLIDESINTSRIFRTTFDLIDN